MKPIDMLKELLNCETEDIKIVGKVLYEWRGITYEITRANELSAPDSHYTKFEVDGDKWAIREVGKKSKLLKNTEGTTI